MKHRRSSLSVALTALLLGFMSLPSVGLAADLSSKSAAKNTATFGTVVSSEKNSFILNQASAGSAAGGPVTVYTTGRTSFVPNSSAAVIAGFTGGDAVYVKGTGKHKFTASVVRYDTAPFPLPSDKARMLHGKYVRSTSSQLSVAVSGGAERTVETGTVTHYRINGKPAQAPIAYNLDDEITISSHQFTDGRVWALLVSIQAKGHH